MQISFDYKKGLHVLLILLVTLNLISFSLVLLTIMGLNESIAGWNTLVKLFFVGGEANIPTWYESCLFLLCGSLLFIITLTKTTTTDPFFYHWKFLALVFVLLSLDEIAGFHEHTIVPMRALFGSYSHYFHFAWIVPGIAFIIVMMLAYLKFLLYLPRKIAVQFIIAAIVFITGAVGFEAVGGYYAVVDGTHWIRGVLISIEELLEMLGLFLFLNALLAYLNKQTKYLTFIC